MASAIGISRQQRHRLPAGAQVLATEPFNSLIPRSRLLSLVPFSVLPGLFPTSQKRPPRAKAQSFKTAFRCPRSLCRPRSVSRAVKHHCEWMQVRLRIMPPILGTGTGWKLVSQQRNNLMKIYGGVDRDVCGSEWLIWCSGSISKVQGSCRSVCDSIFGGSSFIPIAPSTLSAASPASLISVSHTFDSLYSLVPIPLAPSSPFALFFPHLFLKWLEKQGGLPQVLIVGRCDLRILKVTA